MEGVAVWPQFSSAVFIPRRQEVADPKGGEGCWVGVHPSVPRVCLDQGSPNLPIAACVDTEISFPALLRRKVARHRGRLRRTAARDPDSAPNSPLSGGREIRALRSLSLGHARARDAVLWLTAAPCTLRPQNSATFPPGVGVTGPVSPPAPSPSSWGAQRGPVCL